MMVLVMEDDFEFILATFHWCQSSTILLMTVPSFDFFCPYPASSISSVIFLDDVSVGDVSHHPRHRRHFEAAFDVC